MSDVSIERQAELAITLDDAVDKRIRDTVLRVFQSKKDTVLDHAISDAVGRRVDEVMAEVFKKKEQEFIMRIGMQMGKAIAGMTPPQAHKELWETNPYADLMPNESLDASQVFGATREADESI